MQFSIGDFLIQYLVLLLSLSVHESAHAWMADRLGDPTAKMLGRISLNPIVHIDIIGTVILPILAMLTGWALIGWAKPVPVNPLNLKDPRRDDMFISALGPLSNFAMAVAFAIIFNLVRLFLPSGGLFYPFFRFLQFGVLINIILGLFNLIPIPPLDGSGVVMGLLSPSAAEKYDKIRPFSFIILYILLLTGIFGYIIWPITMLLFRLLT